jgi:hypothetical protein
VTLTVVDLGGVPMDATTPVVSGPPGLSAYQVALANGFVGTEAQWLASLVGAGGATVTHTQSTPLATWTIPHTLGRLPLVSVYVAGSEVLADIDATSSSVTITFATPTSGVAVLA